MRLPPCLAIALVAGCGFRVSGSTSGGDAPRGGDAPESRDAPENGDAPFGIDSPVMVDAPMIDAPMIDAPMIDAPMIDAPIDAPPLSPCPPAPTGCTEFTCNPTSCHYVCDDKHSWQTSRDRCVSLGLGCLATIDDASENTCIATAASPVFALGTSVWIGFVQAAGAMEPAGGWGWQCGMSTYRAGNWGTFEPNNSGGNEDCGLMIDGGAWIDGACNTSARYVCELPRTP